MADTTVNADGIDDDIIALRQELEELELSAQIAEAKARITEANVRNIRAQMEMGAARAELAERRRGAIAQAS